mmetsp:Transcript_47764/g.94561  ORF Transcript_47764/g.94561 Transcript_47764/m.94561 type:complete len:206 (-) Transcript_47764:245-862(-)
MTMKRLILFTPSFSAPFGINCAMPGIICMICPMGPIFCKFWNCSYKSRRENFPLLILLSSSGCLSRGIASVIVWNNPFRSPIPSSRDTKDCASNGWNSSKCSPRPRKMMGELVAATADNAPPPLAWPSSLVTMTLPTFTHSLKALACSKQACPMCESMMKTISLGCTASATCCISSNKACSCLCLPDVSTMMRSYFSFLNNCTPS